MIVLLADKFNLMQFILRNRSSIKVEHNLMEDYKKQYSIIKNAE